MKLTHRIENNVCVVSLGGNLALEETEQAKAYLQPLAENPAIGAIVLNCERMQFLDSDGVGWLAALFKTLHSRNKSLTICHVASRTRTVLMKVGLNELFKICDTETQALSASESLGKRDLRKC